MAGIDLERRVYRALNGGDDGLELMLEAMEVRLLPHHGPKSWLRDRLSFTAAAFGSCLRARFRGGLAPLSARVAIYDPANPQPRMRESRAYLLEHNVGVPAADFLGRGQWRRPVSASGPWARWYLKGVWWALASWFDVSERRYTWLGPLLVDMQAYARCSVDLEHVYAFNLFDRRPYLLATFLARHTDVPVTIVYQNIPLYRNCRHLHLLVPVLVTSRVNLEETAYFAAEGSFLASSVEYAGPEYAIDMRDLSPHEPTIDIGYYSSGEWARRDGLYQPHDVELVRRGEYAGNPYAVRAEQIVEALAAYAREHGRTLRIYPHPMERKLLAEHGIELPYGHLLDGESVTLQTEGVDSRSTVYDCRVAVSLQSSFIWERLDLELEDSFIHEFADPAMDAFSSAALGRYARNVFRSDDELVAKVAEALDRG